MNKKLLVAVPAHGWSFALNNTIASIESNLNCSKISADILITNSGECFGENSRSGVTELLIPPNFYWTGAVCVIYEKFLQSNYKFLLLMNHDCSVSDGCIQELIKFADNNPMSVCHAITLYKDTDVIWWGGTFHKCLKRTSFIGQNLRLNDIEAKAIPTDSMMGQCLLLPRQAVDISYLHVDKLPHYFADSVQTCEMRRRGFKLYVIPSAVAYSDQSDCCKKKAWITPKSVKDLIRVWTHSSSSRNLRSVYYASYYHQECCIGKVVMPIYEVTGKIVWSIVQLFKRRSVKNV